MNPKSQNWPIYFPQMLHIVNKENNVGIVTLWAKKEIYIEKIDSSLYNTIGQLYSREEGLSALIRNLLANKNITHLVMVGVDLNHCSDALRCFFEFGVNEKNEVNNCPYYSKVDEEISKAAIEILRNNVKFHDLTKIKDYAKINEYIKKLEREKAYGDFEIFKDAEIKTPEIFPSEHTGFKVNGKYICDVWIDILKTIEKFGIVKKSQYGDSQKEVISLVSVITSEDPDNPMWSEDFDFTTNELKDYMPQVTTANDIEGLDYTYGQKLMKFRNIDQIENMVEQLRKESYSRRAVACTWDVLKDYNNPKAPCLNLVQALVQDDVLHFTCYFRSNDMFGAWPRNAFALRKLQKNICEKLNIKIGNLIIISNSAHIYERSFNKVRDIIEKNKNKVTWKSDPNGTIIITIDKEDKKLIVQHLDTNGKKLEMIYGNSATELYKKISKELKISDIAHALDIGCELQKAEIALELELDYIQDKKLNFKSITNKK